MTQPVPNPDVAAEVVLSTQVRERVVERECEACGTSFALSGQGRPPKYCSDACRQRAWALRQATRQLGRGDPRPSVVREVVDRETVVVRARPAPISRLTAELIEPTTGRHWAELLERLTAQLADPKHVTATNHWHHQKLYTALVHAVTALGQAHPGGLDQLASTPSRRR
nr:hypothetical protein [Kibdelosporangium sp. MJ126-NF4]